MAAARPCANGSSEMPTLAELMSMTGRVSLITGGSGYLGRAMAEALAELGSNLVLIDLKIQPAEVFAKDLAARTGVQIVCLACDLEDEQQIRQIPHAVQQCFGRLDVLINNAGFVGTSLLEGWAVDFNQQSSHAWRRALEVNLTAVFVLTQACRTLLDASGHGSVINVASIYGVVGPDLSLYEGTEMNNPAAYSASKGGLLQLSRWLATVLAPSIRVNAVSPGGIFRAQPQLFVDRYVARTPLARMGVEADFKGVAAFLASDLSSWMTGQNLMVDGGWSIW